MSVEASGGGESVGISDRSGGNNVGNEWSIGIDQIIEESSDQRFSDPVADSEILISDQRFSEEEKKQFNGFYKALRRVHKTGRHANTKPKIQKVSSKLRENDKFKKYFEPKMFAFGPYSDYPNRSTLKTAKQIKVNLAADFLQRNGVEIENLYEDIKIHINELKGCYDDHFFLTYEDHKLAWMFLVDGCAILRFVYITVDFWEIQGTQNRNSILNNDYEWFMVQDLFLLENQLPYQLLQRIIQHTSEHDKLLKSIYKFIFYCFRIPQGGYENQDEILEYLKHDHVHLLDLLRKQLIQPLHKIDKKLDLIEIIIGWIVVLFNKLKCNRNEYDQDRFPVPFPNIRMLSEAGINLKRSKTSCVQDISFSGGTLNLPPITVDESIARMILNMIGYEICPDFHNEFEVSNYMYILNKLIDRTQDLEELREKNILKNELGSDEEMVKLFNEIGPHLIPNSKYFEVRGGIANYFDNKWLVYFHLYFNKRWTLLAFIGSLLAVASTIIQTVITVLAYQADSKKGN